MLLLCCKNIFEGEIVKDGFKVGDKVTAKIDLIDDLTDHGIGCYIAAEKGDELYIRSALAPNEKYDFWAYTVSHKNRTDNSLYVTEDEIEAFAA